MFGLFRYLLALMVVHGHVHWSLAGQLNWLGWYAVFAFFALSGLLMTQVIHETYGYSLRGTAGFLLNRALRVYPPYLIVIALGVAALVALPHGEAFKVNFYLPETADSWARNLLIFGMRNHSPALIPPTWSLHIELVFYMLMAFGLGRTRGSTIVWIAASCVWTAWALASVFDFPDRLSDELASSLPFAAGAGLYYLKHRNSRWLLAIPAIFFVHAVMSDRLWADVRWGGFYCSTMLAVASVYALRDQRVSGAWANLDRRLGDLAYPVFLAHIPVAYVIAALFPEFSGNQERWFLATVLATNAVAFAVHGLVEIPIDQLRKKIRRAAPGRSQRIGKAAPPDDAPAQSDDAPSRELPAYVGMSAVALGTVLLAVGWTRVSYLKFPADFAQRVIPLAFTAAGIGVFLSATDRLRNLRARFGLDATRCCLAASAVTAAGLFAYADCFVPAATSLTIPVQFPVLVGAAAITSGVFALCGFALGSLLSERSCHRALISGIALGSACAWPLLSAIGAPHLVSTAALAFTVAAAVPERTRVQAVAVALAVALLGFIPALEPPLRIDSAKILSGLRGGMPVANTSTWSPLFHVDMLDLRVFGAMNQLAVEGSPVATLDRATTNVPPARTPDEECRRVVYSLASPAPSVVFLGIAGLAELQAPLQSSASDVTVVVPDAAVRALLVEHESGRNDPQAASAPASFVTAEPRSWIDADQTRRDVIEIVAPEAHGSPLPFLTAMQDTASRLFTRQGAAALLEHLTEDGILSVSFIESGSSAAAYTLANLRDAIDTLNLGDTASLIKVFRTAYDLPRYHILAKRMPFTSAQSEALDAFLASSPGSALIGVDPTTLPSEPFHSMLTLQSDDLSNYYAAGRTDIRPVDDRMPYFRSVVHTRDLFPGSQRPPLPAMPRSTQRQEQFVALIALACLVVAAAIVAATTLAVGPGSVRRAYLRRDLGLATAAAAAGIVAPAAIIAAGIFLGSLQTSVQTLSIALMAVAAASMSLAAGTRGKMILVSTVLLVALQALWLAVAPASSPADVDALCSWERIAAAAAATVPAGVLCGLLLKLLAGPGQQNERLRQRDVAVFACITVCFDAGIACPDLVALVRGTHVQLLAGAVLLIAAIALIPAAPAAPEECRLRRAIK